MRCEEIHSKHKLAGRDVVREDTSTVCRRFWEATGGEGSGCGAAELTFTRRKADLIFKRIFLAQYDSKGTGSSDHAARGAFPPRGRCLGQKSLCRQNWPPLEEKAYLGILFQEEASLGLQRPRTDTLSQAPCSTPAPGHEDTRGRATCPQKDGKKAGVVTQFFSERLYTCSMGEMEKELMNCGFCWSWRCRSLPPTRGFEPPAPCQSVNTVV